MFNIRLLQPGGGADMSGAVYQLSDYDGVKTCNADTFKRLRLVWMAFDQCCLMEALKPITPSQVGPDNHQPTTATQEGVEQ